MRRWPEGYDSFPLNDSARAFGSPQITMTLTGSMTAPARAVMPDGEVLVGSFHRIGGIGYSYGSAFGPRGSASFSAISIGPGDAVGMLRGPHTQMLCKVVVNMGHGAGTCEDTRGNVWEVSG
jgi:hypothetical protein